MSVSARKDSRARKFLVVDDHAGFRKLLRELLLKRGGSVVECANGTEALAAFESEQPDCVLMDIEMPGMDGLTATRALCAAHATALIVVVTHHDSPAMREASFRAGARAVVRKDNFPDLVSVLSAPDLEPGTPPPPADRRDAH